MLQLLNLLSENLTLMPEYLQQVSMVSSPCTASPVYFYSISTQLKVAIDSTKAGG